MRLELVEYFSTNSLILIWRYDLCFCEAHSVSVMYGDDDDDWGGGVGVGASGMGEGDDEDAGDDIIDSLIVSCWSLILHLPIKALNLFLFSSLGGFDMSDITITSE